MAVQLGWFWWSLTMQPQYLTYIGLSSPYLISETPNCDTPVYFGETIVTNYTFYKSIDSHLFVRESDREHLRGAVDAIKFRWAYKYELNTPIFNHFFRHFSYSENDYTFAAFYSSSISYKLADHIYKRWEPYYEQQANLNAPK